MPIYEYACGCGATAERFHRMSRRAPAPRCTCGKRMRRVMSRPSVPPDGVYSYAPNVGDPARFERQLEAIKRKQETGKQQVIPRD